MKALYIGILFLAALIDQKSRKIPDRIHLMILVLAVGSMFLSPEPGIRSRLLGAVIVSLPMLFLTWKIPGAFGGGDIKLMAASGLFLGASSTVLSMILAVFTGGGYGAVMLAKGKLKRGEPFAFGPFLAWGLSLSALWGEKIISWYVNLS